MTVRAPLVPGKQSRERSVPAQITRPEYVGRKRPKEWRGSHVQTAETIEKMRIAAPRGMMDPVDVAKTIAFLASDDAAAIHGAVYRVDNGKGAD